MWDSVIRAIVWGWGGNRSRNLWLIRRLRGERNSVLWSIRLMIRRLRGERNSVLRSIRLLRLNWLLLRRVMLLRLTWRAVAWGGGRVDWSGILDNWLVGLLWLNWLLLRRVRVGLLWWRTFFVVRWPWDIFLNYIC